VNKFQSSTGQPQSNIFVTDIGTDHGSLINRTDRYSEEPYVRAHREPVASTVKKLPFVYNSLQSTYNRVVLIS
jgi:hypothetical protein